MEKFNTYNKLGGKSAFLIFLKLIDNFKYRFYNQDYMNTGSYLYFFQTDKLKDKQQLLDVLEYKKSIPSGHGTLKKLGQDRVSFYFAIKEFKLEYGFYDIDKTMVYKLGIFDINTRYLKTLTNRCLLPIKSSLNKIIIKYVIALHKVKPLFNLFQGYDGDKKILDEFRIRCSYDKNIFKQEDLDSDKMNSYINRWLMEKRLGKKYTSHATMTDDKVHFFIKIKENKFRTYNSVTKSFN